MDATASFWSVFVEGADGAGAVGTAIKVPEGGGTSFVVLAGGRGSVDAFGAEISATVALYLLGAPQARDYPGASDSRGEPSIPPYLSLLPLITCTPDANGKVPGMLP